MTLRENNLKEIQGGTILQSEGILVANKASLLERPGLLQVCVASWRVERPGFSLEVQRPRGDQV